MSRREITERTCSWKNTHSCLPCTQITRASITTERTCYWKNTHNRLPYTKITGACITNLIKEKQIDTLKIKNYVLSINQFAKEMKH